MSSTSVKFDEASKKPDHNWQMCEPCGALCMPVSGNKSVVLGPKLVNLFAALVDRGLSLLRLWTLAHQSRFVVKSRKLLADSACTLESFIPTEFPASEPFVFWNQAVTNALVQCCQQNNRKPTASSHSRHVNHPVLVLDLVSPARINHHNQ